MRFLSVLVLVEGPTDVDFLEPVLTRSLESLVLAHVEPEVQVACEVDVAPARAPREKYIVEAVAAREGLDIVALHYDGTAEPERERSKYYEPVARAWHRHGVGARLIAVVPVQEMESWALCDPHELWRIVGREVPRADVSEGDRLARPETLSDPKRTLADIMSHSRKHRRFRADPREYLPLLGERMPLDSLRTLPSYRAFENAVVETLTEMGWTR